MPNDSMLSTPENCLASPFLALQSGDRSMCFSKVSSSRSVFIDPYFDMDFEKPQWNDDSNHHDKVTMSSSFLFDAPSYTSPQESESLSLRPRSQLLRSGRNIFAEVETSYIPASNDFDTERDIIAGNISLKWVDESDGGCSISYIDEDCAIDHVLLTPQSQGGCASSPLTPRSVHRVSRDPPSEFHAVSPSQPGLPFFPCL